MGRISIIYNEQTKLYSFSQGHPFGSDRVTQFWKRLESEGVDNDPRLSIISPVTARVEDLLLFHSAEYISFVERKSDEGTGFLDQGDTPAFPGVYEASRIVVGSTLTALDAIMTGTVEHAFVPVGGLHHARRGRAGGFCVFNDPAVAIEAAMARYKLERILYVDIDVHHGDGVFYEFYQDPRVFVVDIHEDGRHLYPGSGFPDEIGEGKATGTKINLPLLPGANDEDFRHEFNKIENLARKAKPQLIILQCGADGMEADPLAHLRYSPKSHEFAGETLHRIAHGLCDGKLLALGGGGYDRDSTASAWVNIVKALL